MESPLYWRATILRNHLIFKHSLTIKQKNKHRKTIIYDVHKKTKLANEKQRDYFFLGGGIITKVAI